MTSDAPTLLRIVAGGEPTAEEVAALVAALAAAAAPSGAAPVAASAWTDRRGQLRRPLAPAPGAWRASGRVPGTRTRADW
jgi:Acyl-CoA carboxylase epsilon subunit